MTLHDLPAAQRLHVGFFGQRNAGKSSLVNALTGQTVSVVSAVAGTTTDPVKKAMELLPLGPVMMIDTPGFDDVGELGRQRVERTLEILDTVHVAVLVIDGSRPPRKEDQELEELIRQKKVPLVKVVNKADCSLEEHKQGAICVCAATGEGVEQVKEALGRLSEQLPREKDLLEGLAQPGDTVLLVIPIDEAAPKGRLILPQQMTIRCLLEKGATVMACRDTELAATLKKLTPDLVICDSQVFGPVSQAVPLSVRLTSFSILFARYKGSLEQLSQGAALLESLQDGDRVLIAEGCTHHRQCNDIGSVKIPHMIRAFSGAKPQFSFTSGGEFPQDLSGYRLVVHCGGCMLNDKQLQSRLERAREQGIPVVNYGMAIAQMKGILTRAMAPFEKKGEEK